MVNQHLGHNRARDVIKSLLAHLLITQLKVRDLVKHH